MTKYISHIPEINIIRVGDDIVGKFGKGASWFREMPNNSARLASANPGGTRGGGTIETPT